MFDVEHGRDLVRRTASVLSAEKPLSLVLNELAVLLATSLDANRVIVAVDARSDAPVEFVFAENRRDAAENVRAREAAIARVRESGSTLCEDGNLYVAIPFAGRPVGVLGLCSPRASGWSDAESAIVETVAIHAGMRIHDEGRRERTDALARIAETDALTGLANRRSFDRQLANEWRRCARAGAILSLAMIDVDFFKRFNDRYGHVAGDGCLQKVAAAIAQCVRRPGDFVARYGGEEFAVVLPESGADAAVAVAESICSGVRAAHVAHEGSSLGYATLSVGVSARVPSAGNDPSCLVADADAQLYNAKKRGRNRVAAPGYTGDAPAAEARMELRHNLPRYLTESVGRKGDVERVAELLRATPLVTIVGPGGVGKTRLAVETAASRLDDYPDGVWFVDLAPVADPNLVVNAIAPIFDVAYDGGSRPLIDRVGAALKEKRLLLVLDNCEHVAVSAAAAATSLLGAARELRIVATSREPLGVAGERSYRMSALDVPPEEAVSAKDVASYPAAVLFVERAQAVQHAFALTDENAATIGRLARRLDGMPLAIELAAARVNALGLTELDRRLDERLKLLTHGDRAVHPRQRTLAALVGWSYDLLHDAERRLLAASAVFRGSWTLEATERVCFAEETPGWETIDLLSSLVDKSLVVADTDGEVPRYRLLESTRAFAADRLEADGNRMATAARHAAYYAEIARNLNPQFWLRDIDEWLARVRLDLDNLRAAIAWAIENDPEMAAGMVGNVRWYWYYYARTEGLELVESVARRLSHGASPVARQRLAAARAVIAFSLSQGLAASEEAARLLDEGTEAHERAEILARYGHELFMAGRLHEALRVKDEALAAARLTGTARLVGRVLASCAVWHSALGDSTAARRCTALHRGSGPIVPSL